MSGYKNFAVVGAGNIGKFIVDELLNLKTAAKIDTVLVVSRSDASTPEWKSKGATFATIDYDDHSSFIAAFTNIDVVISTVGGLALTKQLDLAKAAKSTSVKLFVPSEFGGPTDEIGEGFFLNKNNLHGQLKDLGLPYSLFFTGAFPDMVFAPPFGWDLTNGKVNIGGIGNSPISFTHREDIAQYLSYVLTSLPTSQLEYSIFRIEGERISYNEIVSEYEKKTGKKLEVTYTSQDTLKEAISKNPADFLSFLRLILDQGKGVVGRENSNGLWPDWNPRKVVDVIA